MTDLKDSAADSGENILPVVSDCDAEILFATHIFEVTAVKVDYSDWAPGENGLESRTIKAVFALGEKLKGELDLEPRQNFDFASRQYRSDPLGLGDAPGCWSRIDLQAGGSWMATGVGQSRQPADLMSDRCCTGVFAPGYMEDVRLARRAEQLYEKTLHAAGDDHPKLRAIRALIAFTRKNGANARDMFARYFWHRVKDFFMQSKDRPIDELAELIADSDVSAEFRAEIASGVTDALVAIGPDKKMLAPILISYFQLLLQEQAEEWHERLVYVELYELIYIGDRPRYDYSELFPMKEDMKIDRGRVVKALKRFDFDCAERIAQWLK